MYIYCESEAQETRHISHGHGVELSASLRGARSCSILVFCCFFSKCFIFTPRTCSELDFFFYEKWTKFF